jgi:MFS family permease
MSVGLVLTVTLVAFEALAVITILPAIRLDLGGLGLYGWVTSAFFLGSLFGIVLAGQEADRRGPAVPFVAGLILFAAGLAIGGAAPSMGVLVLGRAVQGIGAGAIPAIAYVSISRSYPESLQPRIFAVMSTAWVIPGLAGPSLSALIAQQLGWRWVLLGLIPLVAGAGALTLRSLRHITASGTPPVPGRTLDALRVTAGTGLVLAGLTSHSLLLAGPFLLAGLVVGLRALLRLLPAGTLAARPGLPVAVLSRGLLTFAFFGADAFVPLTITSVRGRTTAVASIAVTAATLSWTAGSWLQERRCRTWSSRRLVTMGLAIVVAGIACFAGVLVHGAPLALAFAGWTIGGFGIGLAYAPISVVVLREAPEGQQGLATASMQLADNLGVALGAGGGRHGRDHRCRRRPPAPRAGGRRAGPRDRGRLQPSGLATYAAAHVLRPDRQAAAACHARHPEPSRAHERHGLRRHGAPPRRAGRRQSRQRHAGRRAHGRG